jgi:serine protease
MRILRNLGAWLAFSALLAVPWPARSAPLEWNPVTAHAIEIGPQADRLIVGFKATPANRITKLVQRSVRGRPLRVSQAQTSRADLAALVLRAGLSTTGSRQITPSMHVLYLPRTLYGAAVDAALARLRADPAVAFADLDARRYPHEIPNDPLFQPVAGSSSGQWFMLTPSTATPTSDAAATDAVSAWNITTGNAGTVIADVDSGVRFDHPDLLRAGFGGRLLPGYDFVGEDYNSTSGAPLGTYLTANDADGWDPDPSDPGDWIDAADQANSALFASSRCPIADSSWHGTRVIGVLGAITNNGVGVAGMTWNDYLLPVRALGKCGGYDSDIIAGMQWAVGMSVSGVPDNPYPASIINLSLGGSGSCPSAYQDLLATLNEMGVLVVASAGNASGPVDAPGNCPGVLAVAGLRNVGTKVGYSSFGAEVGVAAPAGNCVNSSGACLRSIDTTVNTGLTSPSLNSYTDETNPNLGTSFSAPIVSGIAALMRAANANLTPAQLIARIESSAMPFPPNTAALPVCPATDPTTGQCSCVTGQCGAGMVNAYSAVRAALDPIAAVAIPPNLVPGTLLFNAAGSTAACGQTIAGFLWSASGGVTIESGAAASQVQVSWNGAAGSLVLMVNDAAGSSDTATLSFSSSGVTSSAPAEAGSSASACPATLNFSAAPPTVAAAFSPASVSVNSPAVLTLTFTNANPFALTQSTFTQSLPANLRIAAAPAPTTSCGGAALTLTNTGSSVTLSNANIPAAGSCAVTLSVAGASVGSYGVSVDAQALSSAPAGGNTATASATLTVSAPEAGGGGGSVGWLDVLFSAALLLYGPLRHRRARVRGRA